MDKHLTCLRFPFLLVILMTALATACAPPARYEPIVRQPVPTLSGPVSPDGKTVEKGTILVARGDTLYKLARAHGVPLRGLIEANRLSPPYVIYPGQRLRLPRASYHLVGNDETVYTIARRYEVDMGSLVRINNIQPPYRIKVGQRLRLPNGGRPAERRVADAAGGTATATVAPRRAAGPPSLPAPERAPAPPPDVVAKRPPVSAPLAAPPPRSGRKFLWPVEGRVIVAFGARKGGLHNDGINIAARKGTAIKAAENGVVAYAGNQLQGFGNLVLIKHSGGWMSAYAHSSVVLVKRGDVVRRGQVIARVGRTGSVTRPQLHFELRRGENAVDPRRYLVRIAWLGRNKRVISAAYPDDRPGPG